MTFIEDICWRIFKGGSTSLRIGLEALISDARSIYGPAGEEFVKTLLERYSYLRRDEYDEGIFKLASNINSQFDMTKTLLCATTADHKKDSAQMVLYDLTTAMALFGHINIHSANRYDRAQAFIGKIDDIVLVDEFVGTGRSIVGRVNTITTHFQQKNAPVPKIHAYVIAGMDFGIADIRAVVNSAYVNLLLKPGLRGFLGGSTLEEAYATLNALEDCLAPTVLDETLPRHGDGKCEALYARMHGNCPNSVLPIFWWPHDRAGKNRVLPFHRIF